MDIYVCMCLLHKTKQANDITTTTRAAEFNNLASVEAALKHGDIAAIVTEPAMTNIGIVLPEPGFMEGLRELATRYGVTIQICYYPIIITLYIHTNIASLCCVVIFSIIRTSR